MSAQSELQSENCEYSQYQNIHNFRSEVALRRRVVEMTYAPTAWAIVPSRALIIQLQTSSRTSSSKGGGQVDPLFMSPNFLL